MLNKKESSRTRLLGRQGLSIYWGKTGWYRCYLDLGLCDFQKREALCNVVKNGKNKEKKGRGEKDEN